MSAPRLGRRIRVLCLAVLAMLLSHPVPVRAAVGPVYLPAIMNNPFPQFMIDILTLTNQQRAGAGCAPLTLNQKLNTAAQGHTTDMAVNDFFDHVGSGGSTLGSRLNAVGYAYWSAGENIAAGYPTAASVMAGWMSSSGHRANILNCSFAELGVGFYYLANDTGAVNYYYYWTQDFGQPR